VRARAARSGMGPNVVRVSEKVGAASEIVTA
jgi:hypothetical protein